MTKLYRIETNPNGESWYTRGFVSEKDEADLVAKAVREEEGVKTCVTTIDLNDPLQRDDHCAYLNYLLEHQRGTRLQGIPSVRR